jgi:mannose-1-phosphate guanylyltransferase / phosphomannomutase
VTEHIQAVVMAGGEGSRLRPLTSNMPKPMLPVVNRPLMEHIIELLRDNGIKDIVVTVQFLSSVIRNYFGDGSDLDVSMAYSTEDVPLGTAGSVLNARDLLSGRLVVISGDALTDIDVAKVVAWHEERGAAATLVLKPMEDPLEFGIVMTDEEGKIERFLEKPTWGQVFSDTVNTGIYVLEEEVLDLIPADQPYDFSSELFPAMLDKGLPMFGYISDAYWTDVGTTDAYLQAHYDVLAGRVRSTPYGFELRPGVWVGEDVEIDPTARLDAPVVVGDSCRILGGARVGPYAVIGDNSTLGEDSQVANSVIMDGVNLGPVAQVRGSVLGRGGALGRGAMVESGAVVGDDVRIGGGALVKPRVKIYPSRSVEAGAIVTQSLVRERSASRSLFGSRGVSGLVNVGLTPQIAVRLGMAYGSTLPRRSVIVTGRDASRAARTLKRALIAGMNSTGITCHDLELMPLPVTRFAVRSEPASGGVSVRTSPRDPEAVEIRFFDAGGLDLPEDTQRKIDRMFFREDYRRPGSHRLGELEFPPHTVEQYVTGLTSVLDVEAIRRRSPKVVVDYAFGPMAAIGASVVGRLGCDALAVNAYTDEHRPVLSTDDLQKLLDQLVGHVRNSGSDLGVLIEPGGEVAHFVDDSGRVLPAERILFAFLQHEARSGASVAVPVNSSRSYAAAAAQSGARLVWTPTSLSALMARASRRDVVFAGTSEGEVMWPRFMPAPDGLVAFAKALEVISLGGTGLAQVIDKLPDVFIARRDVPTPAPRKGAVMRHVASKAGGDLVLMDGVKAVYDDRWALVVPHPDDPVCRIWAEGPDQANAEELADRFAHLVEEVAQGEFEET